MMCILFYISYYRMKIWWFFTLPVFGWSPVVIRYLRIQGNTNSFLKDIYSHTTGKVISSFIPIEGPLKDIIQGTVYECVENKTFLAEHIAKHFIIQIISYEVNEEVHEIFKKITHTHGFTV